MKNIKIKIENKDHSKAIQWLLFELGCGWPNRVYIVQHTDKLFLYVNGQKEITYGNNRSTWPSYAYKETTQKELETELKNRRAAKLLDVDTNPIGSIKIKIVDEEHSIAVQSCLFYIGGKWKVSGKEVCNTKFPYLYMDSKGIMTTSSDPNYFYRKPFNEVTLEELKVMVSKPKLEKTIDHAPLTPAKSYDEKGNASHYAQDRINSIEAMERIFGTQAVLHFCEINAFKYRARIGRKTGESIKENLTKIEWYENAVKFYLNKLRSGTPIATDTKTYGLPWEPKDNEPEAINSQGLEFEAISGFKKYFNTEVAPHRFQSFVNTKDDQTIIDMWAAITEKYNLVKK